MLDIAELISKYGFPVVAAVGAGYLVYYVWGWATKEVKPMIGDTSKTLIALIDRIRTLDNDLIRLNQKVNTVLQLRGKVIEGDRVLHESKVLKKAAEQLDKAAEMDEKPKKLRKRNKS